MTDLYKTLPKQVKIGCYTYTVMVMGGADQEPDRIYGDMNATLQRIRFAPNLSPQRLANTFIHEVLHAIHFYMGVNDESQEEDATTYGANGLLTFFIDNPEAAAWWMKAVAESRSKA